ncbi:hypothetical protein Z046_31745 [Pseudomonas aeruginosa VRFPA09]|nr:hypothetical protein Z046_31745 [Pseudomonas aeruginosa VRFPA09]
MPPADLLDSLWLTLVLAILLGLVCRARRNLADIVRAKDAT